MSRAHRHQTLSGAVRVAFCLGTALLLLVSGVVYFLSGSSPGGSDGLTERNGLLGQGESEGASGVSGSGDGRGGTAGRDAANTTDSAGDGRIAFGGDGVTVREGVDGTAGDAASSRSGAAISAAAQADAALPTFGAGTGGRGAAGRLYDRATGQGLAGARILATAFHGTEDLRRAGTPARYQAEVEVGGAQRVHSLCPKAVERTISEFSASRRPAR